MQQFESARVFIGGRGGVWVIYIWGAAEALMISIYTLGGPRTHLLELPLGGVLLSFPMLGILYRVCV
jgi:hypothetical protein